MDRVLRRYADDPARRLGVFVHDGSLAGYVGFEKHGRGAATTWNNSVRPGARRQGPGRAI